MKAKYLLCPAAFLLLASCNENEVFTKEQYKHVFSFVSNADHVSDKVFNLSDTARVGYIALSMGGSTGTDKDVTVNIVKAPEVLENYNVAQFDNAVDKYARLLPESHYTMASMTFVVKAGHTTGVIPVTVRPEGLSPDSTYYLPLRIQSYDGCEAKPARNYVFYHVRIKNTWAAAGGTSYSMSELRYTNGSTTGLAVPGTKTLYPIGAKTVRMMAGNETFDKKRAALDRFAILLDINDDGTVQIRPLRDIEVVQLSGDADYPNKYFVENTANNIKYGNFLLHYKYKSGTNWYEIKEELRTKIIDDKQ